MKTLKDAGRNVSMVYDHLIVDGRRHDWDPVTASCVPSGRIQHITTTNRPNNDTMTSASVDVSEDFMSTQLSSTQSQQLWQQGPRIISTIE